VEGYVARCTPQEQLDTVRIQRERSIAVGERLGEPLLVHPRLQRLVRGGWMRLGRIDPDDGAMELFVDGAFVAWRQAWPECGAVGEAEVPRVFDRRHDVVLEVPS
jgi:hypothetical protein